MLPLVFTSLKKHLFTSPRGLGVIVLGILMVSLGEVQAATDPDRFKGFEIRVIRPKYLTKSLRFEIGAQATAILNHPFIYSYLGSANLTFHLNEALAIEAAGAWGVSLDRRAKESLKDTFKINTIIHRTQYISTGSLIWTPFYGKLQTFSKKLIYFDFFLTAGGGVTGVDYQYDHCKQGRGETTTALTPKVIPYPTVAGGGGQKIYITKKTALRWDLNYMLFFTDSADANCNQGSSTSNSETPTKTTNKANVVLKLGVSRFF